MTHLSETSERSLGLRSAAVVEVEAIDLESVVNSF